MMGYGLTRHGPPPHTHTLVEAGAPPRSPRRPNYHLVHFSFLLLARREEQREVKIPRNNNRLQDSCRAKRTVARGGKIEARMQSSEAIGNWESERILLQNVYL